MGLEHQTKESQFSARDWGSGVFVWGVWLGMAAILANFVREFGLNMPMWDDWHIMPWIVGTRSLSLDWLWSVWADHRAPLTRLIIYIMARLTGGDFRACMWLSVVILSTLAAAAILVARRIRGRQAFADAIFPLILMQIGHSPHVLQSWNLQNTGVTGLIGALLLLIACSPAPWTLLRGLAAVLCVWLMPLSGSTGIAMLPPMALCLGITGVWQWFSLASPHAASEGSSGWSVRDTAGICALLGLGSLILVPAYFHGWSRSSPPSPDYWTALNGAVMFLSTSFGGATSLFWPLTGVVVLGLAIASFSLLCRVLKTQPEERVRAFSLLCFLVGMAAVGGAAGWGRSGLRPDYCLDMRYSVLSAPALMAVYLGAVAYYPTTIGRWIQVFVCCAAFVLAPLNYEMTYGGASKIRTDLLSFLADMRSGIPDEILIKRHRWIVPAWTDDQTALNNEKGLVQPGMYELRKAGIGPWKELVSMPTCREQSLTIKGEPLVNTSAAAPGGSYASTVTWQFKLPDRQKVYAIRIRGAIRFADGPGQPVLCRAAWGIGADRHAPLPRASVWLDPRQRDFTVPAGLDGGVEMVQGDSATMVIWVDDTIDNFTLRLENAPCNLEISELSLLVP
jgi:hypothetical protein